MPELISVRLRVENTLNRVTAGKAHSEEIIDCIVNTLALITRTHEKILQSDAVIDSLHAAFIGSAR